MWSVWTGKNEQHHIAVHKKYGPIVRTGPNEVSFSQPEAALELFKTGKGFHKTDFYGVFPPPENPDIFTETRESVHGVKKRYAATPYSLATMQQSVDRIEATERLLISKLDEFAVPNKVCDLGDWLHFFAFDVSFAGKNHYRYLLLVLTYCSSGPGRSRVLQEVRLSRGRRRCRPCHQNDR